MCSTDFAMAAKDHRCMRIVDIVKELQDEGKAFYDRSFIRGNVKESMELKIRYNPGKSHIELKGRTKAQVANDMRALRDVGDFYTQHGLVLLSGGSAQALSRRGVKGVHDSVTLGDGACRVLHLLFQQDAQMPLKSSLHHADYEALCLRERERFRKVAMNVFGGNEALIPSPVRKDPSVPCSTI